MKSLASIRVLLLAAAPLLAGGCGELMWVSDYPDFYTPELKTIAVLPFANLSSHPRAGETLTDHLAAVLRANGTYEVLAGEKLSKAIAAARGDGADPADANAVVTVLRAGKLADLALSGAVHTYHTRRWVERTYVTSGYGVGYGYGHGRYRQYPHYGYGRGYRDDWDYYEQYRQEADIVAEAKLVRVADGEVLYGSPGLLRSEVRESGYSSRQDILAEAGSRVIDRILDGVAVVSKQVRVRGGKDLRIAARRDQEGKWEKADKYDVGQTLHVIVALPPAADRNAFRVTIVRKDSEKALAGREFTWDKRQPERVFDFAIDDIATAGGGPGDYEVRFHTGPDVVMDRGFEIRRAKKDR